MLGMDKIVHGWDNFTCVENMHPRLLERLNNEYVLALAYLKAIDVLPYVTWESVITAPDNIWESVLVALGARAHEAKIIQYPDEEKGQLIYPEKTYPGQCHAACMKYYLENRNLKYYIGFCRENEGWPEHWFLHSFLMDGDIVIEPSGIGRDIYTGIHIKNPEIDFKGLNMGSIEGM